MPPLKTWTIALAAALLLGDAAAAAERPHIVFILADDLGYGDVGCYNPQSKIPTPNMDRLAAEGIRFTDAYAPAAVCVPTRYGLLTGRYPFRSKLNWRGGSVIDEDRPTLGSLLREHGYTTACIGKWHLGFEGGRDYDCNRPLRGGPVDRGFDRYFGLHASLDIPPYFYIEDDRCVAAPRRRTAGSREPDRPNRYQGRFWRAGKIARGFDHDEVLDRLTDEALGFLRGQREVSADRPFFLYFALTAPHGPWVPAQRFRGKSEAGVYGDFVVHVDHVVGRVLAALENLDLAEETLVVVTSDNGPLWFEGNVARHGHRASHIFRGRKGDIWEGGVRMPFLARWPGRIPAGETSGQVLSLTDMLATFAALVGEPLPEDAGADSYNMLPALLGAVEDPIRDELIVQSTGGGMQAIRQGPWKLIPWRGSGGFLTKPRRIEPEPGEPKGQLYDLAEDPGESQNLWSRRPKLVERLRRRLEETRRSQHSHPTDEP